MKKLPLLVGIVLLAAVTSFYIYRVNNRVQPQPKAYEFVPPNEVNSLADILNASTGHTLILLCGIEGCGGTKKATEEMTKLANAETSGVNLMRLDIPTTEASLTPNNAWRGAFPLRVDSGRKIATELEFVYYPTIYIFDGKGNRRFTGGYDPEKVASVVEKIAAAPDDKTDYSVKPLEKGASVPVLPLPLLNGENTDLAALKGKAGILVFFGRTSCPFSKAEIDNLAALYSDLKDIDISLVVVNIKEPADEIASLYGDAAPDVPILMDKDGSYATKFGVDAVPYFYLLDADLKVNFAGSFTAQIAHGSAKAMLDLGDSVEPAKAAGG